MRRLFLGILLLTSSIAFCDQVVLSEKTHLKTGDYAFGFVELNGKGSGDFIMTVFACNVDPTKEAYLKRLSSGRWLTILMLPTDKQPVASYNEVNTYEVSTGAQREISVTCIK